MGLAERKAVAAAQASEFTPFATKVKEICGFDVKLNFDWSLIENHSECVWIIENKKCSSYIFDRVTDCLTQVCADDMGKEAVKAGLKEINMIAKAGDLEFANGTLTIRNDVTGNGAFDTDQIKAKLEKGL